MSESRLNYKTYNEKVYFYYGEKVIFQNGKSMPFIVLKKNKNGIVTSTSLYKFRIKEIIDGFEVLFYDENAQAKLKITQTENRVRCEIVCNESYDELCFTLYKHESEKVYGLPSYEFKKEQTPIKKSLKNRFFNKKERIVDPDKKLAFFISESYFFENVNITDYEYEIKDSIFIKVKSENPTFVLVFAKNIYAAINTPEKNNVGIKKYNAGAVFIRTDKYDEARINAYCKENGIKAEGIIIEKRSFDPVKIKPETVKAEKNGIDIIYAIDKIVGEKTAKKYFDKEDYDVISSDKYKIKLDSADSVRKYLVTVRKYLDIGATGIYFDGDFTKKELLDIKDGMKTVFKEYPVCTVFFSTINESNEDFGYYILKNKNVIDSFDKLAGFYLYSGEYAIGKEENKLSSIKNFSVNIVKI